MDSEKNLAKEEVISVEGGSTGKDAPDQLMEALGYEQELNRSFNIWSVLGVGFGLTNSWFGISAAMITGISSGGPMSIIYGILIVATVATFIGITLSELSSAFPTAGGQYVWAKVLAPKKYAPFLSYLCGSFSWIGAVFTSASVTVSVAQQCVGFHALLNPDFVPKTWQIFVAYQLANIFILLFNCYGKWLPHLGNAALYISLASFLVITVTVLACARGHYQTASYVFAEFENGTGWANPGIAFIVGLINPNWSFSCLDCATHLAEEVPNPGRVIPIAIMGTVAIGFVTSFIYAIAMFFSIRDLSAILGSNTGVPIFDVYHQALQSRAGALVLGILLFLTAVTCNISSHTWQARLCWSFARDRGLPGSKYLSKVHPTLEVPLIAHLASCAGVAIIGCIYLASTAAYNAIVTGCISFLLLSYSIPILCLLLKGRGNIKHGTFWLGKLGAVANVITLGWTLFAVVFFCFPVTMPAEAGTMNYASAVLVGWFVWAVGYWYARGKKTFIMNSADDPDAVLKLVLSNAGA